MFIKKIFQDKIDETVHKQFVRFSKGEYGKRAIINVKKGKDIKISTSFELANDLIAFISRLAEWFRVEGIILSREQIEGFEGKKKANLFSYNIAKELDSEELGKLASTSYAMLLDCTSPEGKIDLKIKKKLPQPSKSGKAKVNEKFCQLTLDLMYWPQVKEEFLWDLPAEMKKARIEHSYIIEEVVMSKDTEGKSFEQIRQEAKKKGKLTRKAVVDGKEIVSEKAFFV